MEGEAAARCAPASRLVGEPLAGTAPQVKRWLCVEHPGPWTPTAAQDPELEIVELAGRAADAGWRLTLLRRPGRRRAAGPRRVYFADSGAGRMLAVQVDSVRNLELRVEQGKPVTEPMLLVCAHGARDRCCVEEGRPLAAELAEAGIDVWECSHLGGHRFAATAVLLPSGYVYGRLDRRTALAAVRAAESGEVEIENCRGRSIWPAAGQIAELAVREEAKLRSIGALTVEMTGPLAARVSCVDDGAVWEVRLRRDALGARPASCGTEPEPTTPLVVDAVERVDQAG
jgi:hypothetical protein